MSLEPISVEELELLEVWFTPKALVETFFHDWDNLSSFDDKKFGELRLYQESMLSDESIIDFDLTAEQNQLSRKAIFQLRKNVGDLYCFGARKYGKSMICMTMDIINDMMTSAGCKAALASVDLIHIRQILDPIKTCLQNHPICKLFERRIAASPDYQFELKNGYILNSVNFNIGSKNPGQQFYGKHFYKLYVEEASLENEEVYDKRKDAVSELGAIFRISGMTNFTPQSPAGKAFYGPETHKFVLNYPQFVSPFWDENEKNQRIEQYGGEGQIGYRMFVKGEVVEDCITTFDMQRVRLASIIEKKEVKHIEIPKDRFKHFKTFLVVERPVNSERIFIASDIGLHVTEINVFNEVNNKYEYLYNITLNNLTDDEQATIFKYMAGKLEANVIALDCGDGMGRAIYNELEKTISKDNLVWYDGSMKIPVGFEIDKNGKTIMEMGKTSNGVVGMVPVYKYEIMAEWSVKNLRDLLYTGRCIIPEDYKFLAQLGQVVGMASGTRIIYKCTSSQGDHLFDSFRVFSIAVWLKKDFNSTPKIQSEWGCGATN